MSKYKAPQNKSKKLRSKDQVIVIAGRDKGKQGEVVKVLPNGRLIVAGINMVTKHERGNPNMNKPGGRKEVEASIHNSNVAIFNQAEGKADRIFFKNLEDGAKVRCYRSTGEVIDS